MTREPKHFTIKNVVLLSTINAAKPCNKSEDKKLYKIWVAAKKDILQEVLETAWRPNEYEAQNAFEFCGVKPCSGKVQRALRLYEYENPEDYVTFEIERWNKPFTCDSVNNFDELLMQEFTVTLDIDYTSVADRDEDGHIRYDSTGKCKKKLAGGFKASNTFVISDLDLDDESFDE